VAGAQSERWLDHPWGPVFTIAVGVFLVLLAGYYDSSYRAMKGRRDDAYFRRIRNFQHYGMRPAGWLIIAFGVGLAVWRVAA
jgi:hypothetical protein